MTIPDTDFWKGYLRTVAIRTPIHILKLDDVRNAQSWSSWSMATEERFTRKIEAKNWIFNHPGHVYRIVQSEDYDARTAEQQAAEGGRVVRS